MALLLAILSLSLLCGCSGGKDEAPSPEPPASPPEAEKGAPAAPEVPAEEPAEEPDPSEGITPTQALMRGHFEGARQAREALIRADISKAKKSMSWLAKHDLGDLLPEKLRVLLPPMQTAAAQFDKVDTLRAAGVALAQTLTKCGDCHAAAGKGPTFGVPPLPEGSDAKHHMQRHHWAAERMWEGLVSNDVEAFDEAVTALADAPLDTKLLSPPADKVKSVEALTLHVHELGKQAKQAKDATARAEVYGNLLATCATCHRLLGRGPVPVPLPSAE